MSRTITEKKELIIDDLPFKATVSIEDGQLEEVTIEKRFSDGDTDYLFTFTSLDDLIALRSFLNETIQELNERKIS